MSTAPTPPPTAPKLTQRPWLRILYEVLHEVHAIKMRAKQVPETLQWERKVQILRKKWAKIQTKAQKSSKVYFMREIWWPVWESGRSMPYPGELAYMFLVSGTWILDSIRWGGFRIPSAEFWIPKLRIPGFHKKNSPEFWIPGEKFSHNRNPGYVTCT